MTCADLIRRLQQFPADAEVMILDGFNGGGVPRTLNHGPGLREITPEHAEDSADCEDRVGEQVVTLGYGCY